MKIKEVFVRNKGRLLVLPARLFVLLVIFMVSCASHKVTGPSSVGAWLVYWDAKRGMSEIRGHPGLFDRVSMFAYELDDNGVPQPAPGVKELYVPFFDLSREIGFKPWVTVVNDIRHSDGSVKLKDSDLVHRIIKDPKLRSEHVRALAEKVAADGFKGLDLDYESLNAATQDDFRLFVTELAQELKTHSIELNVVVEATRGPLPADKTAAVSVMAYNLHGGHSGPGPRATPTFIEGLIGRVRGDINAEPVLALGIGGFSWLPDGKVKPVEWSKPGELASEVVSRGRGIIDRVPHIKLRDGSEIWYDDQESLAAKWKAAHKVGYKRLMIWRLGGNDESFFQWLYQCRKNGD
ncbi:MAG: hypothetical protein HQL05_10255 [Nitrospirae bacterium]|nr:hypothetical protein [Nitrospirota bacterium]